MLSNRSSIKYKGASNKRSVTGSLGNTPAPSKERSSSTTLSPVCSCNHAATSLNDTSSKSLVTGLVNTGLKSSAGSMYVGVSAMDGSTTGAFPGACACFTELTSLRA